MGYHRAVLLNGFSTSCAAQESCSEHSPALVDPASVDNTRARSRTASDPASAPCVGLAPEVVAWAHLIDQLLFIRGETFAALSSCLLGPCEGMIHT